MAQCDHGRSRKALTALFQYNIPALEYRALYHVILNQEAYVPRLLFFTTLAGYVHWQLTEKVIESAMHRGMPNRQYDKNYDANMLQQFDAQISSQGYPWQIKDLCRKC